MLRNILDAQEKMMEILLSLKRDTEMVYVQHNTYTVEPLYKGHFGTSILVLTTEVSSSYRSFNTLQHYTETQYGVPIIEVSTFQRFVRERFHCISFSTCEHIVCMNFILVHIHGGTQL